MTATTEDDFLGGRIRLRQPRAGYRAGVDPVLLAASVPARPGQSVLELGTGTGAALLCLMARVAGLDGVGVERDPQLAALAAENAESNGIGAHIVEADLQEMPAELRAMSFDHVLANPPFFDRTGGSPAQDASREGGRGEETPLPTWTEAGIRRLKPGGVLSIIQRIERLPQLLASLDQRVGDLVVLPLAARSGREAKLFVLQAKKGAKGRFRLLPPFVLHSGPAHLADGDDYTPETSSILRDAAPLDLVALMNR
ncbi:tRNA1(Val) (adenine(37)-N6)-methyltransferase [Silicimonas sp. MF1-12-2]|uniref:tRNA1(Val) (adenine(37)-N6)-methyltransferase n=1 Tax=Silicimonas sp. MF1-12-2 TaxID=3384793 RepID=UPI0039B5FF77